MNTGNIMLLQILTAACDMSRVHKLYITKRLMDYIIIDSIYTYYIVY